jgi:hypothetical protein
MTVQELKARAYDIIALRERCDIDLGNINQQISQLSQKETEERKEEVKPK